MDKRYQVFVSSTYTDLKEERQLVTQTLMKMDCIPAGMELFPASDEDQFEFIKRVIDDCDYYLLIIGGRYGSITSEGISYTEKEYDYAVQKGLRVVALLHKNPENIPSGKSESTPEAREKLMAFRDKVSQGRLVNFWTDANGLPGQIALSMMNAIKTFPMVGWIRADKVAGEDLLSEINILRKKNEELKDRLAELDNEPIVPENIASFEEKFKIRGHGSYSEWDRYDGRNKLVLTKWTRVLTWKQIFGLVSPYLLEHPDDTIAKKLFATALDDEKVSSLSLNEQDYQTIKIQLEAYKLIENNYSKTTDGSMALFLSLTPHGKAMMQDLRIAKAAPTQEEA